MSINKKSINFVTGGSSNNGQFIASPDSVGVILTQKKNDVMVEKFGNIIEQNVTGSRRLVLTKQDDFVVNGTKIHGTQTWVRKTDILCEAFVDKKGNKIIIEMATNGYIYINNTLVHFSGIDIKSDVEIKNKNNQTYFKAENVSKIFYHGNEISLDNESGKYQLSNYPIDEFIYIQYKNGSYSNLVPTNFSINRVTTPLGEPFFDYTKNYRCSINSHEEVFCSENYEDFVVTRFNSNTPVNIRISINSVPKEEFDESYREIFTIHEKIPIDGITAPVTITDKATIIRYVVPSAKRHEILRYKPFTSREFVTDEYYIKNGVPVYERDAKRFTINFTEDEDTLEVYSKDANVWTVYDLRQESYFNKTVNINFYTTKNPVFDLRTIGYYDNKDTFSLFVNEDAQKSSKYALDLNKRSGSLLDSIKFSLIRQCDGASFSTIVNFHYFDTSCVNYIYAGDENFAQGSLLKKVSFMEKSSDFIPFAEYGQFIIHKDETIFAHHNELTMDSVRFKTFPLVCFDSPTNASIRTCEMTMPIKCLSIDKDMSINLVLNTDYIRLNECQSVEYKNSELKICGKPSFCFFKASDAIYMIKSSTTRSLSSGDMNNLRDRRKSLNASFVGSPRDQQSFMGKLFGGLFGSTPKTEEDAPVVFENVPIFESPANIIEEVAPAEITSAKRTRELKIFTTPKNTELPPPPPPVKKPEIPQISKKPEIAITTKKDFLDAKQALIGRKIERKENQKKEQPIAPPIETSTFTGKILLENSSAKVKITKKIDHNQTGELKFESKNISFDQNYTVLAANLPVEKKEEAVKFVSNKTNHVPERSVRIEETKVIREVKAEKKKPILYC